MRRMAWVRRARKGLVVLGWLGGSLALSSCEKPAEVRFRVDVKVSDGGKISTFSRVWSQRLSRGEPAIASPFNGKFIAEAIPIPLSGRPTLYALTVGSHRDGPVWGSLGQLPEIMFASSLPKTVRSDRLKSIRLLAERVGDTAILNCAPPADIYCLTLAYLDDVNDPRKTHIVNSENLPPSLGKIKIVSFYITIVNDEPTISDFSVPAYKHGPIWAKWYSSLNSDDPRKLMPEAFRSDK